MCYYEHPALRTVSEPVEEITDEIRTLSEQMIATMRENEGIGLAAPQVGDNRRFYVIEIPPRPDDEDEDAPCLSPGELALLPKMPMTLINPQLTEFSEYECEFVEGCLSIPVLTAPVWRAEFVKLDAQLLDGSHISITCGGLLARCLMHEQDHLDGILFIDHISDEDYDAMSDDLEAMAKKTDAELRKQARKRRRQK
ncbi:MAG: peptide deformylase [Rhodothermales bacterium]|jgi:peptide deformylase